MRYLRSKRLAAFWLMLCAALACGTAGAQLDVSHVTIGTSTNVLWYPGKPLRTFSLSDGDTHSAFVLHQPEGNFPIEILFTVWKGSPELSFDSKDIPIERRMQFFAPLFQKLLAEGGPGKEFSLEVFGYGEFNNRLMTLAEKDPGWNKKAGRPVGHYTGYAYYESLLEKGNAYREIRDALERFHYQVTIHGTLEELRVFPVSAILPEKRALLGPEMKPTDFLPVRIAVAFEAKEMQ